MEIRYKLHENQGVIWVSPSRYRVVVAGRRFGKTTLAIHELFQNSLLYSKSLNWYICPTYAQAKMIAWRMLNEVIPTDMIVKKYETELRLILDNGSEIALKGADNEDTLRGVGVSFAVLDEFAFMKRNVWHEIVRPMLTDTNGRALFIGTPKGKNALWELWLKGQKNEDNFSSWKFGTKDNPFIDPKEIDAAEKELPTKYFRQEYEASFEDYTGLVYPEFNKEHVIKSIYLDKSFPRFGIIDPAISGTTGVLKCALDEDNVMYFYEEYYEANRVSEIAQSIKEDVRWIIDPASKSRNVMKEGRLYTLLDEYRDNGIFCELGEHDLDAGINRVAEYFKAGKIKIFDTCKHLIWELERYHYVEERETVTGIVKPKPYKAHDHLCIAGDEKVLMANTSEKPISDVLIGDYVETSKGKQKVIDSQLTGVDIDVYKIRLSTGQTLEATAGHPIYTNKGKKRLDGLRYGDIIKTWKTLYLRDRNIGGMENIIAPLVGVPKVVNAFMLQFGKMLMALCRKVCAYIILMVTPKTIYYQTSLASQARNMPHNILYKDCQIKTIESDIKNIWKEYVHSLKSGMLLKKDVNGTPNIAKIFGNKNNQPTEYAPFVGKVSKDLTVQNTAIKIAEQTIGVNKRKIWKQEFVSFVKSLFKSTSTLLQEPARIVAVENCNQRRNVYNLTIENSHNYFVNGILVSNCDCLRYMVMAHAKGEKVVQQPKIEGKYRMTLQYEFDQMEKEDKDFRAKYERRLPL